MCGQEVLTVVPPYLGVVPFYRYDRWTGTIVAGTNYVQTADADVKTWFTSSDNTNCPITSWEVQTMADVTYGGGDVLVYATNQPLHVITLNPNIISLKV